MKHHPSPNIAVKANIWRGNWLTDLTTIPYFLKPIIPGDLLVHFLGTREKEILNKELTRIQYDEYLQSRFFQPEGQSGTAFDK